jgi:hypothetical protein
MSNEEMEDMMVSMTKQLIGMRADLDFIRETLVKADTTISKVSAEVMPTLDSLLKSPMLKMLMPKGSK